MYFWYWFLIDELFNWDNYVCNLFVDKLGSMKDKIIDMIIKFE